MEFRSMCKKKGSEKGGVSNSDYSYEYVNYTDWDGKKGVNAINERRCLQEVDRGPGNACLERRKKKWILRERCEQF